MRRLLPGPPCRALGLAFVLLALEMGTLQAQTATAKITGTVTDSSGAFVAGARISITNVATGTSQEAVSNNRGVYSIPFLNPGHYELKAEAAGFKRYNRQNVVLETEQAATFDIALAVGDVTENVTVTAEAPLLQSETATVGQLIESKNVADMPLVDRRPGKLVELMGNMVWIQTKSGFLDIPQFSMAGGQGLDQMWYMDGGVTQNNPLDRVQFLANPPVASVHEVNVLTNIYSAEYGHSRGGYITLTTKSGTNEFHGSLYEFFRNDKLNARPFFSPGKFPRRDNVFGGTVGGPIKRNRTFFFANVEGDYRRLSSTSVLNVPTPAETRGDFSGRSGAVLDPLTSSPFANNVIPASRLDSVGKQLAQFFPAPNVPGRPANSLNYAVNSVQSLDQPMVVARLDHEFNSSNRLYLRFMYMRTPMTNGLLGFGDPAMDTAGGTNTDRQETITGSWTHNFGPALLNEFRYSVLPTNWSSVNPSQNSNINQKIGLAGVDPTGAPLINVAGLTAMGHGQIIPTQARRTDQFFDSVTMIRGSHAIKMGVEWTIHHEDYQGFADSPFGTFGFTDRATGAGFALAALLLGQVNTAAVVRANDLNDRMNYYAGYVEDDWKVTPRLTLNLGLRWDMDTPRWESNCRQSGFDAYGINPASNTPGVITFACQNGQSKYPHNFDKNNFGPRFGFAWRPWGEKTVLRGGFGVMYSSFYGNFGPGRSLLAGFSDSRSFQSADGGLTPTFLLQAGVPATSQQEALTPAFGAVAVGKPVRFSPEFFFNDRAAPYGEMFSLSVQRQLLANMLLDLTYQGNLGHKLVGQFAWNINEVPPALRLGQAVANQTLRPFPQFGNVNALAPTAGNSNYHAMNIKLEKRFSHGLNFQANYTWAKAIDDTPNSFDLVAASGGDIPFQSIYNRRAERGVSGNDITHRFVTNAVWELPVGKGKMLDFSNGPLNYVLGGWGLGQIVEARTGPAFGVYMQTNLLNAFSPSQRPNIVGDPAISGDRSRGQQIKQWFNTAAFASAGAGIEGNAARGIMRGPGFFNVNISVLKNFPLPIKEGSKLEFRAEFFNLLNHPNFGLPGITVGSPNFGTISTTVNDGRIIQLGLQLLF